MRIFGYEITKKSQGTLSPVAQNYGGWLGSIREAATGYWQRNIVVNRDAVSAYWAVFACITLNSSQLGTLEARVMQRVDSLWVPTILRPVLRKPNHYQTRVEFFTSWVISLMLHGNCYVLKRRDENGFVVAMYILDPSRVTVLVATDGSIYYQLRTDNLSELDKDVTVPASEIIHDRINTLHHPLVGLSPIYACGVAAMQGLAIQNNSANFFTNGSMPGGIIMVPGALDVDQATALKAKWETNYGGTNRGKTAVLADKMTYQALTMNASDSQLIEQLKMTAEQVCACFHVPGYMIGVGQMPTVANTGVLKQQYYDGLRPIIENMELRLDEGLELQYPNQTWFDLSGLLRMDPASRYDAYNKAIVGGWLKPNEARSEEDRAPVDGGDACYLQQQNYSLAALDRRDQASEEGTLDIQATAMNGGQVTSLQGLIVSAATGEIPAATARAAIAAAFPLLTPAQIDAIIEPIGTPEPVAILAPVPAKSALLEHDDTVERFTKSLAMIAAMAPITIPARAMN